MKQDASQIVEEIVQKATAASATTTSTSEPPLWNRKLPQTIRQQEQAWHRLACRLAGRGYTAVEIAEQVGCTPTAVQEILKQPQFQGNILTSIEHTLIEDEEVVRVIRENVVSAVITTANIMKDEKVRSADRLRAAEMLLNRRYGMPNQPINQQRDINLDKMTDEEVVQTFSGQSTQTATT